MGASAAVAAVGVANGNTAPVRSVVVAIVDRVPLYRRGLTSALREAGLAVEEPDDLGAWLAQAGHCLAVVALRAAEDWRLLEELNVLRPDAVFVAILPDSLPQSFGRALSAGASTAVPQDAEEEHVRNVVDAAAQGNAVLPAGVVQTIAASDTSRDSGAVTAQEAHWLSALGGGTTVAMLAHQVGYSEREMYRLLRRLYRRLGATSRAEALVAAARHGLIG
jgi:DNA-binding NarL/FixJ family response regulator